MKYTSEELSNQLANIKANAISTIKELMEEHNVTSLDFTECGNCPVVIDGDYDEDTYTLDNLHYENGKLTFHCSSCEDSAIVSERIVTTDCLIQTLMELEDDYIFKYNREDLPFDENVDGLPE